MNFLEKLLPYLWLIFFTPIVIWIAKQIKAEAPKFKVRKKVWSRLENPDGEE